MAEKEVQKVTNHEELQDEFPAGGNVSQEPESLDRFRAGNAEIRSLLEGENLQAADSIRGSTLYTRNS